MPQTCTICRHPECPCPDLLAAIRDLHIAIGSLHDELRALHQALPPPSDTEGLVARHTRPQRNGASPRAKNSTADEAFLV